MSGPVRTRPRFTGGWRRPSAGLFSRTAALGEAAPLPGLRRSDDIDDVDYPPPQGAPTAKATAGNLVWTRDSDGSWTGPATYAVDYILAERADEAGLTDYGDE